MSLHTPTTPGEHLQKPKARILEHPFLFYIGVASVDLPSEIWVPPCKGLTLSGSNVRGVTELHLTKEVRSIAGDVARITNVRIERSSSNSDTIVGLTASQQELVDDYGSLYGIEEQRATKSFELGGSHNTLSLLAVSRTVMQSVRLIDQQR